MGFLDYNINAENTLIQTMSLVPAVNDMHNPAIDNLVLQSELRLQWILYEENTYIEPTQIDHVYYASRYNKIMVLLGSSKECTTTLVSEYARIYSLPTHKYNNDVNQFRRYSTWLSNRNELIEDFTKDDDNY